MWQSNIKNNFEKVMCDKQSNGLLGSVERERLLVLASE
jgi:hypothetical protein